jgi:hypothetical protein
VADLEQLHVHLTERSLNLPKSPHDPGRALEKEIRGALLKAVHDGLLTTALNRVLALLERFAAADLPKALAKTVEVDKHIFAITGGKKNQGRSRNVDHFERNDGAWFDFSIVGRDTDAGIELLAYDFELRLPPGEGVPFLRFDLNPPKHRNDDRELRSHVHCGSDDWLIPAPLMTPAEVLTLFLRVICREGGRSKARLPTGYEREWLATTLSLFGSAIDAKPS